VTEHGGHEHDPEDLREVARERMRDLPGETAGGRIDPATVPREQWRKSRGSRPAGSTEASGADSDEESDEESDESPPWDESTHGEAARQALGIDPERASGAVLPDAAEDR